MTRMKKTLLALALVSLNLISVFPQNREPTLRTDVPLDSIRLSDPFILADGNTSAYYMTGTGGMLWKSNDLEKWTGPFRVIQHEPARTGR